MAYQIAEMVLGLGCVCLCSLLYRTQLIPRFLSISGLIGYPILVVGTIAEIFGLHIGLLLTFPGMFFELVLPSGSLSRVSSPLLTVRIRDGRVEVFVVTGRNRGMANNQKPVADPSEPTVYPIRISGELGPQWADWFEGLAVTLDDNGDTLLSGPVVDQAALHGLLRKVRDLGTSLISVTRVEPDPPRCIPAFSS